MAAHNYVVTAHKPTSVTHSLVGNFTSPTDINLILCKSTRVEVLIVTDEGLQPLLEFGINGRVAAASLIRFKDEKQHFLFIATEKYKFCLLAYDAQNSQLITRATGDVSDRIGRPSDVGQLLAVDPEGRLIGLYLYEGLFKVIPIDEKGLLAEGFNIRMEELTVIDIKILHACKVPTIAVLFQDNKDAKHVKTYEISVADKSFKEGPWNLHNVDPSAELLCPVPKTAGILIFGNQSIVYHSKTGSASTAVKSTVVRAVGEIDASRFLVGDFMGNFSCLILSSASSDPSKVTSLQLEHMGTTSCPSSISFLGKNDLVFVGSTLGDSQLIRLHTTKNPETGQYIETVNNYVNLGPIVDFCTVDAEKQGQVQVVTCSGAYKDGSLRIIRNGIGIHEHAQIELPGIKGIWSLNPAMGSNLEKILVVSFVGETRILAMAGEQLEETEIEGFKVDQQTLYCGNVFNGNFLQVTTKGVYLVDASSLKLLYTWTPEGEISVTSCNEHQVAICTQGKTLTILEVSEKDVKVVNKKNMPHEISCVTVNPVGPSTTKKASVVAVCLWTDISVRLLVLPSLEEIRAIDIGGEIIARSVYLTTFTNGVSYLIAALGDGRMITWEYDPAIGEISNKKRITLGTRAITLNKFFSGGKPNIFACSDRPTVVYPSEYKSTSNINNTAMEVSTTTTTTSQVANSKQTSTLLYTNVNLKEVTYMCDFDCKSFPGSLALATENTLIIGSMDEIRKLHIRSVYLGEMPRRISHAENSKSYCLLTIKLENKSAMSDSYEEELIERNYVKLIDDQTFEVNDSYALGEYENGCSVATIKFNNDPAEYFVVGTAIAPPTQPEPTDGRILVFSVSENKLRLQAERSVKAAVFSIADLTGKLVAGVGSKVIAFSWEMSPEGNRMLKPTGEHKGNIMALYLATRGDFVAVGDLMKSMTLLVHNPTDGSLKESARDYNPNWMTAVELFDDENLIGAENSFNVFSLSKNNAGVNDEERNRLEVTGEFHLGEFVNKFRHGSFVMKLPDNEGPNVRGLIWGSVSGAVGIVAEIPMEFFSMFLKVQSAMEKKVKTIGQLSNEEFRHFSNERKLSPGRGFIDGDLIESFMELSPALMHDVATESGVSVDDIVKAVETITRALH